jgi:hypothetical protein
MPLEYNACLENGLEVVKQCARWFYSTNASHYNTQGFDYEDIEGHLNAEVLMRYLDLVEKHPDYYLKSKGKEEIEAFRSSLYQSCRNACFAHHRKHIRSQKRGLNLRQGMVHLDHSELNSQEVLVSDGLIVPNKVDYAAIYKPVADSLYGEGKFNATRLWCLLWHENNSMKAELEAAVEDKDKIYMDVRKKILEFLPWESSLPHHIMNQTEKNKFKEMAQRAIKAGVLKVPDEEPEDSVSKLLSLVSRMDEAQAETVLEVISGGGAMGLRKNGQEVLKPKREAIMDNAKKWLVIDYEIVSDALDIEINPEMNPLIIRRLLDSSLERINQELKAKLPEIVWEFVRSINEVFPDTYQEGSKLEIREIRDSIMVVVPPIPAPSFISRVKDSRRWMSWIDSNSVRFWQESETVLFESTSLKGVDQEFMKVVLESLSEI